MLARMALRRAGPTASDPTDNLWLVALRAWWQRPAHAWLDAWAQESKNQKL